MRRGLFVIGGGALLAVGASLAGVGPVVDAVAVGLVGLTLIVLLLAIVGASDGPSL